MDDSSNIWLVHSFASLSRSLVIYRICHCYPQRIHCVCALTRYVKLRVAHAPGMPGTFSPPLRVSDSDMHHGTCVTHVPWCMPESLSSSFLWSRWRGKSFRYPRACVTRNFTYLARGPFSWRQSGLDRWAIAEWLAGCPPLWVIKMCLWDQWDHGFETTQHRM